MKPSEIINQDAKRLGQDPEILQRKIASAVKAGSGILLQNNNSLVLLISIGKGIAEAHFYSVDSPVTMTKSLQELIKKINASDIEKIYGNGNLSQVKSILTRMQVDVQPSDIPNYSWMAILQ